MDLMGIDIDQIAELGTQVAANGALHAGQMVADQVFEYIIGLAILIYEMNPG